MEPNTGTLTLKGEWDKPDIQWLKKLTCSSSPLHSCLPILAWEVLGVLGQGWEKVMEQLPGVNWWATTLEDKWRGRDQSSQIIKSDLQNEGRCSFLLEKKKWRNDFPKALYGVFVMKGRALNPDNPLLGLRSLCTCLCVYVTGSKGGLVYF